MRVRPILAAALLACTFVPANLHAQAPATIETFQLPSHRSSTAFPETSAASISPRPSAAGSPSYDGPIFIGGNVNSSLASFVLPPTLTSSPGERS